jgi:transcriptional regulator with XRE-family HTH domain
MAGRDPQTDPRGFLGDELTRARLAAGYKSQEALAAKLGFDRSVIGKAETGDRPPTPDVLAAWCDACQMDAELFERFAKLARRADGPVPAWFEAWLDAEREAQVLRDWAPIILPALFHTDGYARALLLKAQTDTSDETIDAMVAAKLARRAIFERPDPPDVTAVIDEAVLHHLIGSAEIMYEQLALVPCEKRR